ncbi:hypothetical protein D9757_001600 [Collybiopsis confluens]|uniref:Uncharacterized protein n=1 Tax=Collybiopsis confluens TaxID=2823264 RepID=A0A8H5HZU7_9AGAR|nr:hypothetical protein D9757_001600 [Collybiopsis confluens]
MKGEEEEEGGGAGGGGGGGKTVAGVAGHGSKKDDDDVIPGDSTGVILPAPANIPSRQLKPKPRSKPPPRLPSMPTATLSGLPLHSPSSNIIGTPFTVDSYRFEYPFPDPGVSSRPSSARTPPSLLSSSITLSAPTVALSTSPPFGPDARIYSPTHHKMRIAVGDPPIPPGLVKKRQRWSLGLARRESSFGSGSQTSGEADTGAGPSGSGGGGDGSGGEQHPGTSPSVDVNDSSSSSLGIPPHHRHLRLSPIESLSSSRSGKDSPPPPTKAGGSSAADSEASQTRTA